MLAHDEFLERMLWQITNLGSAHVPSTPVPYLMLFTVHAPYRFIRRRRMCLKHSRMQRIFLLCRSTATSIPVPNPTVAAFEERIASLEGGIGAVATASAAAVYNYAALAGSGTTS